MQVKALNIINVMPWAFLCKGLMTFICLFLLCFKPLSASGQSLSQNNQQLLPQISHTQNRNSARIGPIKSDAEIRQLLITWAELEQKPDASFKRLYRFMKDNPDWPYRRKFEAAFEKIMSQHMRDDEVIVWFQNETPATYRGLHAYLSALKNKNQYAKAAEVMESYFQDISLFGSETRLLLQNHRDLISPKMIQKRADHKILEGQYAEAEALFPFISADYKKLIVAKIALHKNADNANMLLNKVPSSLKNNEGLLLARAKFRRRAELFDGAYDMVRQAPTQSAYAAKWWREKNALSREFLERQHFKRAYDIAKNHHAQSATSAIAEGEFLAGWLALRKLNNANLALGHFKTLYKNVKTPISLSRGAYWTARAYDALGDEINAIAWYKTAAQHITTFYGQIAYERVKTHMPRPPLTEPILSAEQKANFKQNDLIRATLMLKSLGLSRHKDAFMNRLINNHQDDPETLMYIAKLGHEFKQTDIGLRAAKEYHQKTGRVLFHSNYPLLPFALPQNANRALVHALIRQESLFNPEAMSPVGARGLMQLMPKTAEMEAKALNVRFDKAALTQNPQYNVHLGSFHMNKLIARNNGSKILAVAAYNAGQGNVNRWLRTYGDPRSNAVDDLDWIESIPFSETRNYVMRVLENKYVYALRLNETPNTPQQFYQTRK
jgi:soluble lytic murein transglycosylase